MADILDKRPVDAEMTVFKTEVEPNKLNACIDDILMRLNRLEDTDVRLASQWISVDDKLPDSDTTVLVWYTADSLFGRFGDYGVTHYRKSSGWSKASLIGDDQAIFYWMPLPEPPKESEENG